MSGTRQRKVLRHVSKREARSFLSPPEGPWVPFAADMLESAAWRALSRAGLQMISRLAVEHARHAGKENGRLAVSWDAFEGAGIHRGAIRQTLEEVTRLGFVRCTDKGRKGYGSAIGRRATYRLTFAGVVGDQSGLATDDWSTIETDQEALAIVAAVRAAARRARSNASGVDIDKGTETNTGPKVRISALAKSVA